MSVVTTLTNIWRITSLIYSEKECTRNCMKKTVKDENCPRPGNCDGLMVAKMNKLVWDVMSPQTRSNEKKMQQIATSIVKAGIFLTKNYDDVSGQ
ncbi:hypothetical protein DPMN_110985 [Dreissena polymorpha]|uniref:Uncharacterized protein n=1 Tax=Dreissena polymorpha TaxID=45954 RepID=A0A9D4KDS9_DREPO|nr:hypothetical protein DPMN_110985 [Dreissena polymorpha]